MSDTMTDEFRAAIRAAKADIRSSGVDLTTAFEAIDALVEIPDPSDRDRDGVRGLACAGM